MSPEQGLIAVGLSHHTAPVEVRERLAFDHDGVRRALSGLRDDGVCDEALLLSTCNRVELYAVPRQIDRLRDYFASFRAPGGARIEPYLYWHQGEHAVRHLFRVASSLDSLVLGEPQILGQVKEAVRLAEESRAMGKVLHRLAHRSLSVAKRVRTETRIGASRVGIGNAGVDLALQIFGSLDDKRALLLGVGEMGHQVAKALLSAGLTELIVANRTRERADELASETGGTAIAWERVEDYLARVDIVIAATGSALPIVTPAHVRAALKARRYRPLFLVDLSVPRNIHPDVSDIEEAYLFDIDDLSQVVERGYAERKEASYDAERLVDEEAARFMVALKEVEVGDEIGRIIRKAEAIRRAELDRSTRTLEGLAPEQLTAIDAMTRAMVKKLLHDNLAAVRTAARAGDGARLEALLSSWKGDDER